MSTRISGRGYFARPVIVDEQDLHLFAEFNWTDSGGGYLVSAERATKARLYLHRLITGATRRNQTVDHINGDTYDNRRCNLRVGSKTDNACGARVKIVRSDTAHPVSKYIAVAWHPTANLWVASFRNKYLGLFSCEEDAARAVDSERVATGYEPRYPQLGILTKSEAEARKSKRPTGPRRMSCLQ